MSPRLRVTLAAAVVLGAAPAAATAQGTQTALLSHAMERYRDAQTVVVDFDQTVTNPLTGRSATSRGELQRRSPNLLSISFSSPAADRIVADGSVLWVYLPSSAPGQVLKLPAGGARGVMLDPLGQVLGTPLDHYDITANGATTLDGRSVQQFTLAPKSQHTLFTRAVVWVDSTGAVRQLEATEPSGLVRRIHVTAFRTGVPVPASAFRFTPPADARVVDQSGAGR